MGPFGPPLIVYEVIAFGIGLSVVAITYATIKIFNSPQSKIKFDESERNYATGFAGFISFLIAVFLVSILDVSAIISLCFLLTVPLLCFCVYWLSQININKEISIGRYYINNISVALRSIALTAVIICAFGVMNEVSNLNDFGLQFIFVFGVTVISTLALGIPLAMFRVRIHQSIHHT